MKGNEKSPKTHLKAGEVGAFTRTVRVVPRAPTGSKMELKDLKEGREGKGKRRSEGTPVV